ncbi:hypothetical protein [Sphingobacterium wenxiniae]|uniref:Lipoprotein n=1 Tax=Sphingobacterium wenxiniae TaxID=683125 RepID=A0A1I6VQV9_9SPHI|nr:hypothetical protein [Sphingobacterium wenxiniae]SFT15971.1 hypothetical protein SAMN05660206_11636 [Sphingobacterium wenxiniae]
MKTLKNYLLATTTALIFTACGGNNANQGNDSQQQDGTTESATASAGKASKAKKYNAKCFEDFDYDYSKMLTKADVLKHVSVSDPDALEVNFKESRSSKKHNEYSITWASDRPDMVMEVKAGGTSVSLPQADNNIVAVEQLEFKRGDAEKELSAFDRAYGQLSEQEYREMEERIDQQQADKSEEERKVMKSMIRARENMKFHPVANVGSGAYWEREEFRKQYFGTNLYVLAGTVQFRIKVKVSNDDEENARIAALLAQEVLAKCN